jgi:hypothetical protein
MMQEKFLDNQGGNVALYLQNAEQFLSTIDLSKIEEDFIQVSFLPQSLDYVCNATYTEQGTVYEIVLSWKQANIADTALFSLIALPIIAVFQDSNENFYLIGNQEQPLLMSYSATTGKSYSDLNHHLITLKASLSVSPSLLS